MPLDSRAVAIRLSTMVWPETISITMMIRIAIATYRHDESRVCISVRVDGRGLTAPQRELIGEVLRGGARACG